MNKSGTNVITKQVKIGAQILEPVKNVLEQRAVCNGGSGSSITVDFLPSKT